MLEGRLHHRQRAGFEGGTMVFDGADERRGRSEAVLRQVSSELKFGIHRRLDAPEQLQHVSIISEDYAVALIAVRGISAGQSRLSDSIQPFGLGYAPGGVVLATYWSDDILSGGHPLATDLCNEF